MVGLIKSSSRYVKILSRRLLRPSKTDLESAQGTAGVRTGIPIGEFLSQEGAVRHGLSQGAVPEKTCLVYDMRRNRGDQADV